MPEPATDPFEIEDATCLACGCLCDDVRLRVERGRIVAAEPACERGRTWFLADHGHGERPDATIDGVAVEADAAIGRAAELLKKARSPVVLGLTTETVETVAAAVALADQLGAAIGPSHAASARPALEAFRRVGKVSATLGEVRDRADVIVFWRADPLATHHRHAERYSFASVGRFRGEGRTDRVLLVADRAETRTMSAADLGWRLSETADDEALFARLRAAVLGRELDEPPSAEVAAWADRLKSARFGAFFHEKGLDVAAIESAYRLVRDLNDGDRRFVILPLGGPGNPAGAEAVLAWQSGFPLGVDFASGTPVEADVDRRIDRGEADLAIVVGDLEDERLRAIPTIRIGPGATRPGLGAAVGLASATAGIDAGGSVVRVDGAWLPLRPALVATRPDVGAWLARLAEATS